MAGTTWKDLQDILFKLDAIIVLLQQIKNNQSGSNGQENP